MGDETMAYALGERSLCRVVPVDGREYQAAHGGSARDVEAIFHRGCSHLSLPVGTGLHSLGRGLRSIEVLVQHIPSGRWACPDTHCEIVLIAHPP
jgi:hypothetical protein